MSAPLPAARGGTALKGSVALVTGGASGLGRAICGVLAAECATVAIADVDPSAAEETASVLVDAGADCIALPVDVADAVAVDGAVDELLDRCGRWDVLVNNAGVDRTLPVGELTLADWDRVLDVNLRAPFVLSRRAFRDMEAGGQIVNIVSTAARRAWANAAAYHASKWGLLGLSHAIHVEGRSAGIKVTAVIAGGMRTPFILDRFPDVDPEVLQDPANVADVVRYVLTRPAETVIPEVMVLPVNETSWP